MQSCKKRLLSKEDREGAETSAAPQRQTTSQCPGYDVQDLWDAEIRSRTKGIPMGAKRDIHNSKQAITDQGMSTTAGRQVFTGELRERTETHLAADENK